MFNSLKYKFIVSFVTIEFLFLILIATINFNSLDNASKTLTDEKIEISSKLFIELIKVPLITYDLATLDDAVISFASIESLVAIRIDTTENITLSNYIKDTLLSQEELTNIIKNPQHLHTHFKNKYILSTKKVTVDSQDLGYIYFIFDASKSFESIQNTKLLTYIIIILALIVGLVIAYIIGNKLGNSIKQLTIISDLVTQEQEVRIPYKAESKDEIGILFNSMHNMQKIINERSSALKNSINHLEEFMRALNESAIVSKTDASGVITYINSKFTEITGYSEEEIIGKTHNLLRSQENSDEFFKDMWNTISAKKIFHATFQNIKKDGDVYYVDSTIVPLLNNEGEIEEYIAVRYDATDIVNAKNRAMEAKKIKEDFLSNMSHEIRTPMNAILGFTGLLKKNLTDSSSINYVNIIEGSSRSLLLIINDILDFSKIESGKLMIEDHPFNPTDELQQAVELFTVLAKEEEIKLSTHMDSSIPECLSGDILRIKQILNNFLSNAIKFTPHGKNIHVHIDYEKENSIINITVEDEGVGISKDAQKKIFTAFEQEDNTTARKFGGTGLGLTISTKLADLMNGKIVVESEIGKGSSFTLSIPLNVCNKSLLDGDLKDTESLTQDNSLCGHILVAEDNPTNQMLIEILLEDFGLTYEIAHDGLEAVEAINKSKFDMILMDGNMPNMTGTEAAIEIRKYEAQNNIEKISIVALTANVTQDHKNRFIQAGMDDFLAKPIDVKELENILRKYL